MKIKNYIIGCGGVGSYFLPPFAKTLRWIDHPRHRNAPIVLVDGDVLETKNLKRQQFATSAVGVFKAEAAAAAISGEYPGIEHDSRYIDTSFTPDDRSVLFVFCDNHIARKDALAAADRTGSTTIIAANSSIGAHSYVYLPEWKGGPLDPRVRFPEILTDLTGSPVQASGCASEENLEENPQTPIANFMAASHALLLWNFWSFYRSELDRELTMGFWPVELSNTATTNNTVTYGNIITRTT